MPPLWGDSTAVGLLRFGEAWVCHRIRMVLGRHVLASGNCDSMRWWVIRGMGGGREGRTYWLCGWGKGGRWVRVGERTGHKGNRMGGCGRGTLRYQKSGPPEDVSSVSLKVGECKALYKHTHLDVYGQLPSLEGYKCTCSVRDSTLDTHPTGALDSPEVRTFATLTASPGCQILCVGHQSDLYTFQDKQLADL